MQQKNVKYAKPCVQFEFKLVDLDCQVPDPVGFLDITLGT